MYPHGTIYEAGKRSTSGEVNLRPTLIKKIGFHLLRGFGAGVVAFAIVGIIFSFYPIVKEELIYRFGKKDQIAINYFGSLLANTQASDFGIDPYFSIYVPKINAKSKIIPNVDPGNAQEYLKALTQGVAHAKGTNFPGQRKEIYLFSHSTDSPLNFARYNAVFYLLGKLQKGDKIVISFMDKIYIYQVTDKVITSADDTSWLKDDGNGEKLVLQTCDPPGTSWRRLLIIAKPVK